MAIKNEKKSVTKDTAENKMLVAVVNRGFAEHVIEQSRLDGATGATILHGRGSAGTGEMFMGLSITPEKEVVLIVLDAASANKVKTNLEDLFTKEQKIGGVCFCVPVDYMIKKRTVTD